MTRTRHDQAKIATITVRYWWNTRGPWTQVFVLAALVCAFELAFMWAAYPYLERMVIA